MYFIFRFLSDNPNRNWLSLIMVMTTKSTDFTFPISYFINDTAQQISAVKDPSYGKIIHGFSIMTMNRLTWQWLLVNFW